MGVSRYGRLFKLTVTHWRPWKEGAETTPLIDISKYERDR